jgi:hypothetical protein
MARRDVGGDRRTRERPPEAAVVARAGKVTVANGKIWDGEWRRGGRTGAPRMHGEGRLMEKGPDGSGKVLARTDFRVGVATLSVGRDPSRTAEALERGRKREREEGTGNRRATQIGRC